MALVLQVQVDPTATATPVALTVYEEPVLDLPSVDVSSGFASVLVVPTGPVEAGTNSQFVLTATPAEGVTNPGPVDRAGRADPGPVHLRHPRGLRPAAVGNRLGVRAERDRNGRTRSF